MGTRYRVPGRMKWIEVMLKWESFTLDLRGSVGRGCLNKWPVAGRQTDRPRIQADRKQLRVSHPEVILNRWLQLVSRERFGCGTCRPVPQRRRTRSISDEIWLEGLVCNPATTIQQICLTLILLSIVVQYNNHSELPVLVPRCSGGCRGWFPAAADSGSQFLAVQPSSAPRHWRLGKVM